MLNWLYINFINALFQKINGFAIKNWIEAHVVNSKRDSGNICKMPTTNKKSDI
jgi:hypothetical protein